MLFIDFLNCMRTITLKNLLLTNVWVRTYKQCSCKNKKMRQIIKFLNRPSNQLKLWSRSDYF